MLQYWGGVLKKKFVKFVVQDLTSGGLLGVWGKWVKHAKYIYNIQDFNPEQVLAVGYTKSKLVTDAMMWFDKFSCKRSDLVITVGRDLVETVENRFKGKKVPKTVMINNWIDETEIYPLDENNEKVLAFKKKYGLNGKFVIMYSGNIGLYYDLENLIKVVEKIKPGTKTADGREVVFAFVGAGSVLDKLVLYVKEHHMDNVTFIPYQDNAFIKIASVILIFTFVKSTSDLWKYIFLMAASTLIANFTLLIQCKKYIKKLKLCILQWKIILKDSIMLFLPQVAVLLYLQVDKIMLKELTLEASQVAFYDQAEKIVTIPLTIIKILSTVIMPKIANSYAKDNKDEINRVIMNVAKYSLFAAVPMMFGIASVARGLIPWYLGNDFLPVGTAIKILAPIVVLNSLIGIS